MLEHYKIKENFNIPEEFYTLHLTPPSFTDPDFDEDDRELCIENWTKYHNEFFKYINDYGDPSIGEGKNLEWKTLQNVVHYEFKGTYIGQTY